MIKNAILFLFSVTISVAVYLLFNNSITTENSEKQLKTEQLKNNYLIYSPLIPDEMSFAGETVPSENFDIFESFDNEMLANAFWHSQMMRFIKRANRYFPIIEPILKENNIPDDFKYLAVAESGLANVVSSAKATGFWQFMPKTAKDYKLVVNREVDERYNLEKSTQAACNYLNKAYERFGNWTLVAASYNMGMGGLSRRLAEQKVDSYYDLFLNQETARYVYRIVAIKTIMTNPSNYGFKLRKQDLYKSIPFHEVTVDTTINDLKTWALEQGVYYKVLKNLNPWLRKPYLKNIEKRTFQIKIPEKGFRKFASPILDSLEVTE